MAENIENKEKFAVKIEKIKNSSEQTNLLKNEVQILYDLKGERGFPRLSYFIKNHNFSSIVMTLLSTNLEILLKNCGGKFSLKTVLLIADQTISRLEFLHSKSFIHRDIKPDNFLIGLDEDRNIIHLIDFGLSKKYVINENLEHIPFKKNQGLIGTARFASINSHLGLELSRRDDLESLGYLFIYFLKGELPWIGLQAENRKEKFDKIKEVKLRTPIEILTEGLPVEFSSYLKYAQCLQFEDTPNYVYLKKIFRNLRLKSRFNSEELFDWDVQKEAKIGSTNFNSGKFLTLFYFFCQNIIKCNFYPYFNFFIAFFFLDFCIF